MAERKILTRDFGTPGLAHLPGYEASGGYQAYRKMLKELQPDAVVEMVKKSGLRGRGGAGFGTGQKWSFLPKGGYPRYLVINADESEPGCFKDRYLIEESPHQVVEGLLVAAYAIGCNLAFIYIRGEYLPQHEALEWALDEARQAGYIGQNVLGSGFDVDVILHRGAGAYICGEETAMLTSLEGYRGEPRLKPPFPAIKGLYGKPTVVNNVETVATLPHIINNGAEWFAAIGTPTGAGTRLWCMSGHVNRPGNYELEMGTPIRELIYDHGGGIWKNRQLKAFQPGGASMMVLLPEHLDVGLDFDAIQKAGSLAGAGAMVVMDETTCMVDMSRRYAEFFHHESCGKCTPCREGTYWMTNILTRIEEGEGKPGDPDLLVEMGLNIDGRSFCPLGDAATWFPRSTVKFFRDEFMQHISEHGCPFEKERVLVA
jgi:NADH-quinone oxidoreductase subunit F